MFKRLTAFLLLLALINCAFSRFAVFAGFELNRSYIAQNLCVNKSRPALRCEGRCYFMKKIKQADENEKKQNAKDSLSKLEISYFEEPFNADLLQLSIPEETKGPVPVYAFLFSSRSLEALFQPPRQIA